MADYLDAAKEFHLVMMAGPSDEISIDFDGNKGLQTAELALEHAKNQVDECGGEYMVYRCVPYKIVKRGATKVAAFKAR